MVDNRYMNSKVNEKDKTMNIIRKTVGWLDRYGCGVVKYIDFTYCDHIIVWVEYKTCCKAFLAG